MGFVKFGSLDPVPLTAASIDVHRLPRIARFGRPRLSHYVCPNPSSTSNSVCQARISNGHWCLLPVPATLADSSKRVCLPCGVLVQGTSTQIKKSPRKSPATSRALSSRADLGSLMVCVSRIKDQVSLGIFPGLLDRIQGRLSQKSSLIISRCSITTLALARFFFSFSACDFDCATGSAMLSASSATLWLPGSTNSYYTPRQNATSSSQSTITHIAEYNAALLVYRRLIVVINAVF